MGSLILREQLIQYNVFRYKGVDLWFDYMSEFDRYCDDNWYAAEACSKNVLLRLGISDVLVGMDMVSVLAEWRSKLKKIGLSYVPEVSVNNLLYSGNFEGKDVAEMACASISNPPDACSGDAGADRQ